MKDLPVVEDYGDGFCSRLTQWDGMIVSYETFTQGCGCDPPVQGDCRTTCVSHSIGAYILRGRVRIKRKDGDFVLKTGDVYYLEPGHVPVFEEDTDDSRVQSKEGIPGDDRRRCQEHGRAQTEMTSGAIPIRRPAECGRGIPGRHVAHGPASAQAVAERVEHRRVGRA